MFRSLSLPLGAVLAWLCAAGAHADTIYQCAGHGQAEVLQNWPCPAESEVWVQKDVREANSAPPVSGAAAGEPANLPSELELGMTQQQVRALLGEPTAVTQEEVVDGREVTWTYGDSRAVQFDSAGRLSKK